MELDQDTIDSNLALLQELLCCGDTINVWTFNATGALLVSTCKDPTLARIFTHTIDTDSMIEYGSSHTAPLLMGSRLGITWAAAFKFQNSTLRRIYVIGPVFNSEVSEEALKQELSGHETTVDFWRRASKTIAELPVISSILMYQYVLMLHYCVTGEKLQCSDIAVRQNAALESLQENTPTPDRHKIYETERALLRMVREGDRDYRRVLDHARQMSFGVKVSNGQPFMQALASSITFTSLCTRAAIEGGLPPDTSYTVGDSYIQTMIQCKDVIDLSALNAKMYDDFIERVHKRQNAVGVSPQIQQCCDYIELHLDEPLNLTLLSSLIGYAPQYLSHKFKQEMYVTAHEYIRFKRIERAKTLLTITSLSIADIARNLRFSSSSHFSQVFREATGQTPRQWRTQPNE